MTHIAHESLVDVLYEVIAILIHFVLMIITQSIEEPHELFNITNRRIS